MEYDRDIKINLESLNSNFYGSDLKRIVEEVIDITNEYQSESNQENYQLKNQLLAYLIDTNKAIWKIYFLMLSHIILLSFIIYYLRK